MAKATTHHIKLSRFERQPWGFRLHGGADFATPLLIQLVRMRGIIWGESSIYQSYFSWVLLTQNCQMSITIFFTGIKIKAKQAA